MSVFTVSIDSYEFQSFCNDVRNNLAYYILRKDFIVENNRCIKFGMKISWDDRSISNEFKHLHPTGCDFMCIVALLPYKIRTYDRPLCESSTRLLKSLLLLLFCFFYSLWFIRERSTVLFCFPSPLHCDCFKCFNIMSFIPCEILNSKTPKLKNVKC